MRLSSIVIVLHLLCATVTGQFLTKIKRGFNKKHEHVPGRIEKAVTNRARMKPIFEHANYKLYRRKIVHEVIVKEIRASSSDEKRAIEKEIDILTATKQFRGSGLEKGSDYDTYYILISNLGKTYEEMLKSDEDKEALKKELSDMGKTNFNNLENKLKAELERAMEQERRSKWTTYHVTMASDKEKDPNNYLFKTTYEVNSGVRGKRKMEARIINYSGGIGPSEHHGFVGLAAEVWDRKTK
ncbi:hypothetical protein APHAL10511_004157 [Amanita phalloides]|nr:hypothetical protein APHAL10511_004157 [Amanita phalloides]